MFSTITKGMFKRPNHKGQVGGAEFGLPEPSLWQAPVQVTVSPRGGAPQPSVTSLGQRESRDHDFQEPEHIQSPLFRSVTSGSGGGMSPRIVSLGGGKGGIGKSFISANVAVSLAQQGFKVALVDLDFGAANLHSFLGMAAPRRGLYEFVTGQVENLEDVALATPVPGLTLLGGGHEFWQAVRPQAIQKIRLVSKLQKLPVDYVILDLGAGTHTSTLDFFIFSHAGMIVVMPEPTSIENAYVFLKSVLYRKLQSIVKAMQAEESASQLLLKLNDARLTTPPYDLVEEFARQYPEYGRKMLDLIKSSQLGIVMNQVRTKADADVGTSMAQISRRYFGFQTETLGSCSYDDAAWQSIRNRKSVILDAPHSVSAVDLKKIAAQFAHKFLPVSPIPNREHKAEAG